MADKVEVNSSGQRVSGVITKLEINASGISVHAIVLRKLEVNASGCHGIMYVPIGCRVKTEYNGSGNNIQQERKSWEELLELSTTI